MLTGTFDFEVLAATGQNSLTDIQAAVSVNDSGNIAFVGSRSTGQSVYFAGSGSAPQIVSFGSPSSSRTYGRELQINNNNQIAAVDTIAGGRRARIWNANNPGFFTTIARSTTPSPPSDFFDALSSIASIANDGQLSFTGLEDSTFEIHLSDQVVDARDAFSPFSEVTSLPSGSFFRFRAADGDRVVVAARVGTARSIVLHDITGTDTQTTIATTTGGAWSNLGIRPGIADDGNAVTFFGDLTAAGAASLGLDPGAGIFAFVESGGAAVIERIAGISGNAFLDPGEVFEDDNGNGTLDMGEDKGGFSSFSTDALVGIGTSLVTAPADPTRLTVSFVATGQQSGQLGLYVSNVNVAANLAVDGLTVLDPALALAVGDSITGLSGTVSTINQINEVNNFGDVATIVGMSTGTEAAVLGRSSIADNVMIDSFSHFENDPSRLALTYELATDLTDPFSLAFFNSDDGTFDSGTDLAIGSELSVSSDLIQNSNGALSLRNESGATESSGAALSTGRHVLVIDVAALADSGDATFLALEQALLDQDVEIVLAVADSNAELRETTETDNDIAFQGFYQRDSAERVAVRSAFGTDDEVDVESGGLVLTLDDGNVSSSVTLAGAADILIVTSSGSDAVLVDSAVTVSVIAVLGDGDDFAVGGAGDDELHGGMGTDVLLGEGFGPTFTGPELTSFLDALAMQQIVLGSVTLGPVGTGSDMLFGDEDFDVLFGGGGSDMLESGDGGSIVFADAFTVSGSLNFNFSSFLNSSSQDNAESLLTQGLVFQTAIGLPGDGSNTNEITGGSGFDLVFGSAGADNVDTGGGTVDVVFGFGGVDTINAGDTDSLVAVGGDGNDIITGGSTANILVGGAGNDSVTGGAGADVVIGDSFTFALNGEDGFTNFLSNFREGKLSFQVSLESMDSGQDTLSGLGGFDVLVGGDGADTLTGGDGGGLLFGDAFNLTAGPSEVSFESVFDGSDDSGNPNNDSPQTQETKKTKSRSLFSRFLTLLGTPQFSQNGSGDDVINGGSGIDLIVGGEGNDVGDGGAGASFVDILIGNEGNDTLTARQSFLSIMFGGIGDDTLEASTVPGSLGSILFGDGFRFLGVPVNPTSVITFDFNGLLPVRFGIATGLVQDGNGADRLTGARDGFNLMVGGGGNDTLTGAGLVDFMLGDSVNLGVEIVIDFSGVSVDNTLEENFESINTSFELPGLAATGNDVLQQSGNGFTIATGGDGNDVIDGGGGTLDILSGNAGVDTIRGNAGFNVIAGGIDSDSVTGGDDGNLLLGDTFNFNVPGAINFDDIRDGRIVSPPGLIPTGDGDDTITGGQGLDVIIGGSGDDLISAGNGFNAVLGDTITVTGQSFNFFNVFGAALVSAIFGDANGILDRTLAALGLSGTGDDTVTGGSDIDVVFGGDGDDSISGGGGPVNFLVGGNGNDTVVGNDPDEVIFGGPGDDELSGGAGNDRLESEGGDDIFRGGNGNDSVFGGEGNDQLFGEDGDDELNGENGQDVLDGGDANDVIRGGAGNDRLSGGAGSDLLDGGDADDMLFGGPGNDRLIGGAGIDLLQGDEGSDTLINPDDMESTEASPVQVDLRLVLSATPTDANGHVANLTTDVDFLDEWDDFFVEIWASTPNDDTSSLSTYSLNLRYDVNLFSANSAEFGPGFSLSQVSGVDDDDGIVDLSAATVIADAGRDEFVLLGRVSFVSAVADDLPNNQFGAYILPSLGARFVTSDVTTTTVGGVEADTTLAVLVPEIWPVMFDLDDNGTIGFGDVTLFAAAFGGSVGTDGSAFGSDFDRNGVVGFGDVSVFANNFSRSRDEPDRQSYAGNFPVAWRPTNALRLASTAQNPGGNPNVSADPLDASALRDLADTAVELFASAGLDESATESLRAVDIVVRDLPTGILGRAEEARILIDVNASGVGWFVGSSPMNHNEFSLSDSARFALAPSVRDRIDLLSVIAHELGHIAGLHHTDDGFMQGTLASGERRLPAPHKIDAHFATFHHVSDASEIDRLI